MSKLHGVISTGKLHTIKMTRSEIPYIDKNLKTRSKHIQNFMLMLPSRITKQDNHIIHDSSWEMAAIMSLKGKHGTYSGVIKNVIATDDKIIVTFGSVPYINIKDNVDNTLKTSNDISQISFSRL